MLLKDKLEGYRLILASASPRRRELLAACDLDFVLADKIRDDLLKKGIRLIDTREGTSYEII